MGPQHTFNSPHLPTLTFPYISPYLPHTPSHFPTPPFIPLPTSLLPPPTPQHIFLLSPHLPSPSQSVAKLPCDEVCVAKLLWRSYHVAKLLATVHRFPLYAALYPLSYQEVVAILHKMALKNPRRHLKQNSSKSYFAVNDKIDTTGTFYFCPQYTGHYQ